MTADRFDEPIEVDVFAGTDAGGVVRLTGSSASATPPVVALRAAGWHVAELGAVADEAGFHAGIAAVLGFPDHYGRNLDALWDCLTDLTEPTAVLWSGWSELAVRAPQQWARVLGVLRERATEPPAGDPAFAVVLTD